MGEIMVTSMLSYQTKTGRVQIEIPDDDGVAQLSQEEATNLAENILQAVAAARMDEFLWKFAKERLDLEDGAASAIMSEFREFTSAKIAKIPAAMKEGRGKYGRK
jgi:hypothetical protein